MSYLFWFVGFFLSFLSKKLFLPITTIRTKFTPQAFEKLLIFNIFHSNAELHESVIIGAACPNTARNKKSSPKDNKKHVVSTFTAFIPEESLLSAVKATN